jgi:hypothetical protein
VTSPVSLNPSGPPETRLPDDPAEVTHLVRQIEALEVGSPEQRAALQQLVAIAPRSSTTWSVYGRSARDSIERYAAYRVGYHRGLDALRGHGWKGSGFVRWNHPGNVGFLSCLAGLQRAAEEIGETDEAERCRLFLLQLDPSHTPSS